MPFTTVIIMRKKKVFVSGCFDLLHSGHFAFFEEAASYGDVYAGLGSDSTIRDLKERKPRYNEDERLYMVQSLRFIKDAWINGGSGYLDFFEEIKALKPDIFFVNEDGESDDKKQLCKELGIDLIVKKRIPKEKLPTRSSTALRATSFIPFRLDLAGGWLDQPYVGEHYPGAVITISIEPDYDFNSRSGMSSSTRSKAIEIWGSSLPDDDPEKLARILFSFENPPGKKEISGSQDSIGIVFPGLNKSNYNGEYWPQSIEKCRDEDTLSWIEQNLHFIPLSPRWFGYDVLASTDISKQKAKNLSDAAAGTWKAIMDKNAIAFGNFFRASFEAQIAMFPNMVNEEVLKMIQSFEDQALGWKLSGAGGGGYLVLVAEIDIPGSFRIRIRR